MSNQQPEALGPRSGPSTGWAAGLIAAFGPVVIWVTGVWLTSLAVPSTVDAGQCEGLGFGCQLSPSDGVVFSGAVLGLGVVPVATVATMLFGLRGPVPQRLGRVLTVLCVFAVSVASFGATQVAA